MTDRKEIDARTAERLLAVWSALREGKLKVAPQFREPAEEFMAAPLNMVGLVDTSRLSERALSFGRTTGMALVFMAQREPEPPPPSSLSMAEAQPELFRLFAQLFAALTGRAVALVANEQEIKDRMLWRLKHEPDAMAEAANAASDELAAFYSANAVKLFQHAKTLGGMRLVTGGQRAFGPSALNAVRITGLYADTQLLPDPVYPFLSADLHLNAKHLQLANALFYVLQLRPLVDAGLPVPPVFVFPEGDDLQRLGSANGEPGSPTEHGVRLQAASRQGAHGADRVIGRGTRPSPGRTLKKANLLVCCSIAGGAESRIRRATGCGRGTA